MHTLYALRHGSSGARPCAIIATGLLRRPPPARARRRGCRPLTSFRRISASAATSSPRVRGRSCGATPFGGTSSRSASIATRTRWRGIGHRTGMVPSMRVPEDMPLDVGGRLTCATCHDPHATEGRNRWLLRRPRGAALCRSCHQGGHTGARAAGRGLHVPAGGVRHRKRRHGRRRHGREPHPERGAGEHRPPDVRRTGCPGEFPGAGPPAGRRRENPGQRRRARGAAAPHGAPGRRHVGPAPDRRPRPVRRLSSGMGNRRLPRWRRSRRNMPALPRPRRHPAAPAHAGRARRVRGLPRPARSPRRARGPGRRALRALPRGRGVGAPPPRDQRGPRRGGDRLWQLP